MTCSEEQVAAFLGGELGPDEAAAVDAHLLVCETCWRAVREDRAARPLLRQLLEPAPPGLEDRVRLSIELASADRASAAEARSRRRDRPPAGVRDGLPARGRGRQLRRLGSRLAGSRRRLVAVAAATAVLAGALGAGLGLARSPGDPPAVAAVVAMASSRRGAALVASHRREPMTIAGRRVAVAGYRVRGVLMVVATSRRPFAMPAPSPATGSSDAAWMATRGAVGVYCLNARPGAESVLVAAAMPAVELPALAAQLGLLPQ